MDYIITKTINETFGVADVETPAEARAAFEAGKATPISHQSALNVTPRPQGQQQVQARPVPLR
jgi:hypothetical protein